MRFLGLTRRGRWDLAAWGPLVRLLRSGAVDVVHGHMFGSNVWAVVLGRLTGVPVVIAHEHSWAFSGDRTRRLVDRHVIGRGSDVVIACSEEDRRRMIEVEGIAARRVLFVPNGIAAREPTPGLNPRLALGLAADAPVVGSVGALRPEKRFDVLLRAAARLVAAWPGLRVVIVGAGPERGRLEALAAELGLVDAVMLLGARTDVPDVIRAFDVAVNCSDFEGTPLSVLEYMEAGLPVVATRVGGLPSLIDHGVHGLLGAATRSHGDGGRARRSAGRRRPQAGDGRGRPAAAEGGVRSRGHGRSPGGPLRAPVRVPGRQERARRTARHHPRAIPPVDGAEAVLVGLCAAQEVERARAVSRPRGGCAW